MPLKKKTYHIYQLSDATVGMTDVFCVDWYKFKCTTYMAADCRRYTRYVKWYTQCSGDDSSPSNVTNIPPCGQNGTTPDMSSRPK